MPLAALSRPPTLDEQQFRAAAGSFATGVAVMTTRDVQGAPHGITCNSFASLSLDPPLILWSIRRQARAATIYAEAEFFAVNVLAADQQALSKRFSSPLDDRFAGVACEKGLHGVPLLAGCVTWMECRIHDRRPGGDHLILIAAPLRVTCFDRLPLIFWRGKYFDRDVLEAGRSLGTDAPDMMFWA